MTATLVHRYRCRGWPGGEWWRRRAGAGSPVQPAPSRSFRAVVRGGSEPLGAGAVLVPAGGYRIPRGKPGAGGERSIEVLGAQLLAALAQKIGSHTPQMRPRRQADPPA